MPTTAEYLERLVQAKNNIADAITNAGGTVNSGDGLEDFSTDIGTIPIGGNIDSLTVYSNGTYTAPTGTDGYNPVNVYVANSYSASDEGKVVDNGALVSQTSTTKTVNGTYDTTLNNEVVINVPNTYTNADEGKVVSNGALVSQTSTSFNDNGTYNTTTNNSVTVAVPLTTKSITSNGTYNASSDSAKGYTSVDVAVPNTYTNADEGKVVNNNALVSQTSASDSNITTNGTYTYDTTYNNSKKVIVAVPNTYTSGDEGKVVDSGALVSQTSTNINTNGTYNTTTNNEVVVAVPNTYTSGDEGKVVSNGALVSQTSDSYTTNGTYDTTLINSVTVNVAGSTAVADVFPLSVSIGAAYYGATTSAVLCVYKRPGVSSYITYITGTLHTPTRAATCITNINLTGVNGTHLSDYFSNNISKLVWFYSSSTRAWTVTYTINVTTGVVTESTQVSSTYFDKTLTAFCQ